MPLLNPSVTGSPPTRSASVRLVRSRQHGSGRSMNNREILNVFEALLLASQHPGITQVEQYGPGIGGLEGVKVRFEWTGGNAWAYLFTDESDLNPAATPFADKAPLADVPDAKSGGTVEKWLLLDYVLKLAHGLCEAAKPSPLSGWTPVALKNIGHGSGPTGLAVTCADGTKRLVRVTIGSGATGDPKSDPWPGYVIPVEEVQACQERKEPARL